MKRSKRPNSVDAAMRRVKAEANNRVLERGLVQFRLDAANMQQLLDIADEKGLGYGVLARMWVCEQLEKMRSPAPPSTVPAEYIRELVQQEVREALRPYNHKGNKIV